MTVGSLRIAYAVWRKQADDIAPRMGTGSPNDELASNEPAGREIAKLFRDFSWRLAGMLVVQTGLIVALIKLL